MSTERPRLCPLCGKYAIRPRPTKGLWECGSCLALILSGGARGAGEASGPPAWPVVEDSPAAPLGTLVAGGGKEREP